MVGAYRPATAPNAGNAVAGAYANAVMATVSGISGSADIQIVAGSLSQIKITPNPGATSPSGTIPFSAKAYDVYLSFYRRTKYSFDTSRATKDGFAQWTRALFEFQDLVIVGAFSGAMAMQQESNVETTSKGRNGRVPI